MSSLINYCDILLLEETLLNNDNKNILENTDTNSNAIQVSSVRKSNQPCARFSGGLVILHKKNTDIKYFPLYVVIEDS